MKLNGITWLVYFFVETVATASLKSDTSSGAFDAKKIFISPLDCYDRSVECNWESDKGYCITNFHYMTDRCPWSCRLCKRLGGDTEECKDQAKEERCIVWAAGGDCVTRPEFMTQNCKRSCEICGPESDFKLTDYDPSCPTWAKHGWCQSFSDLHYKCPHSCQKYKDFIPATPPTKLENSTSNRTQPEHQNFTAPTSVPPVTLANDLRQVQERLQRELEDERKLDAQVLQHEIKEREYMTHPLPRTNATSALVGQLHSRKRALKGNPYFRRYLISKRTTSKTQQVERSKQETNEKLVEFNRGDVSQLRKIHHVNSNQTHSGD